jgi:anti-sigma factor RsiW
MNLRHHHSDRSDEAALARLADGSIAENERAELEHSAAASPELAAKLAEQRRAIAIVAAVDVEAPARLLERLRNPQPARRPRRRWVTRRGVIAVAAVIVILALLAARNHGLDVRGEAHLALARATLAPPRQSANDRAVLTAAVGGAAFPSWRGRGWRATGARSDALDGRSVETVFYDSSGYGRVGYSIVAGSPLAVGNAQSVRRYAGVSYAVLKFDGATVVTWPRDGHTCVLASRRAPVAVLLGLAGWA